MNFLVFILISLRKTTNILDILYRARDFFYDCFVGWEEVGMAMRRAVRKGCGEGLWGRAGTDATPAAFNLGLCLLHGILSPPSATTTFRRRAILPVGTMTLQAELFYFAAKTAAGGTNLLCGNEN